MCREMLEIWDNVVWVTVFIDQEKIDPWELTLERSSTIFAEGLKWRHYICLFVVIVCFLLGHFYSCFMSHLVPFWLCCVLFRSFVSSLLSLCLSMFYFLFWSFCSFGLQASFMSFYQLVIFYFLCFVATCRHTHSHTLSWFNYHCFCPCLCKALNGLTPHYTTSA